MSSMLTRRGELALWFLSIGACLALALAFWLGFQHGARHYRAQLEGREPIPGLELQNMPPGGAR